LAHHFLGGVYKTPANLSQDSRSEGRGSKPGLRNTKHGANHSTVQYKKDMLKTTIMIIIYELMCVGFEHVYTESNGYYVVYRNVLQKRELI
jgi:hypothetical protein